MIGHILVTCAPTTVHNHVNVKINITNHALRSTLFLGRRDKNLSRDRHQGSVLGSFSTQVEVGSPNLCVRTASQYSSPILLDNDSCRPSIDVDDFTHQSQKNWRALSSNPLEEHYLMELDVVELCIFDGNGCVSCMSHLNIIVESCISCCSPA